MKGEYKAALKLHKAHLSLAQELGDYAAQGRAYGNMGNAFHLDAALSLHSQELTVRKDLGDQQGECRALGHLAAVHMGLGDYATAFQCYETQLGLAQGLRDPSLEAQVHGNMGITKMNMGKHFFICPCCPPRSTGSLQQALVCLEKRLVVAHELGGDGGGKAQAYGELGTLHSQLGNYEQALSCLEHQLNIARSAGVSQGAGQERPKLQLLNVQISPQDKPLEAEASDALGGVYRLMGDNETALQWHQRALDIAEQTGCVRSQARACGNLGLTYEALGKYERAVVFQEQHLSVAAQTNDLMAKTLAYGSLGRTHHALLNYAQAVMYLIAGILLQLTSERLRRADGGRGEAGSDGKERLEPGAAIDSDLLRILSGLRLAEQLGLKEDEAKIRHGLGLSLWAGGNLEEAQHQV
uniref:Tetratricopeptide repeat domain 24 n=1 Tax=Oryzias melastigma TaxID=30732 RepID=A0A3B3CV03_ORYME